MAPLFSCMPCSSLLDDCFDAGEARRRRPSSRTRRGRRAARDRRRARCARRAGRPRGVRGAGDLVHEAAHLGEVAAHRAAPRRGPLRRPRPGSASSSAAAAARERRPPARVPASSDASRSAAAARRRCSTRSCARSTSVVHVAARVPWDRMKTSELDYDLPPELIAQHPAGAPRRVAPAGLRPRSETGAPSRFAELPDVLGGALVVVNDTRVVPARMPIEQPQGEVLLLERLDDDGLWEGLARPTRRLRPGRRYGAGRAARAPRRGTLAPAASRRAGRRDAAAAVHHRAARRSRAVPDGLRARRRLGRGADGRPALHAGAARAPRRRARDAARRARHVPPGRRRRPRRARAARRALRGRPEAWERIRARRRVLAVGHDDGARARDARARRAARRPDGPVRHARLRVPSAPTRC